MSRRSGTLQLTTPAHHGEIVFRLGKVVAAFRSQQQASVGESLIDAGLCSAMVYQEMLAKQKEGVAGPALFAAFGLGGEALDAALEELLKRAVYGMFEWKEGTFSFVLEDQPDPWRGFGMDGNRVVVERGLNPQYLAIEGARLRDEHTKEDALETFISLGHEPPNPAVTQANSEALARSLKPEKAPAADVPARAEPRADDDWSQVHVEAAAPVAPMLSASVVSDVGIGGTARAESEKVIPFPANRTRRDGGKLALARQAEPENEAAMVPEPVPAVAAPELVTAPEPAAALPQAAFEPPVPDMAPEAAVLPQAAPEPPAAEITLEVPAMAATLEATVDPAAATHGDNAAAAVPVSPWSVLVVDDDPQVLQYLNAALAPRFARLTTASTVLEALTHVERAPAGLLILADLIIARSDGAGILGGIEILEKVRTRWPHMPVVLFTDYQNEEAQARAVSLGVTAQLTKPRKAQIYADDSRGLTPPMRDFLSRMETTLTDYIQGVVVPKLVPEHYDLRQELALSLADPNSLPDLEVQPPPTTDAQDMSILRSMIVELRDPSSRDAVTLLVLRYASSVFERGALFLTTRRAFVGLGGFANSEASDRFVLRVRQLQIPVEMESAFSKVARFRALVRGHLDDTVGNRRLIAGLGGVWHNHETVAAPLISGDRVAAILFGDNPSGKPLGNTDGLEIFMQQAGLVMERALLERKLEETRQQGSPKK